MRSYEVTELASFADADVLGDASVLVGPDVVIDSRRVTKGCLFVAIRGERFDGHEFVSRAAADGAAAALVSSPCDVDIPQLVVADTIDGLTQLATGLIQRARAAGLTSIALTGSSGKTSTKDLLAQLLADDAATVAPPGSLNNEIGVPLTACEVGAETRYLVSELGARGIGHIAHLCRIVTPEIGLVLNVGVAHLGEFGGVEATAKAKGELVESLPSEGWAILNADDPRVRAMAGRTRARIGYFSVEEDTVVAADLVVRARGIELDARSQPRFMLEVQRDGVVQSFDVALPLTGYHQAANAAAAAAAAIAAGVAPAKVAQSLRGVQVRSAWRMALSERSDGVLVLNDAYNANPDSMRAALRTLAELVAAQRRGGYPESRGFAVLGDMLELGPDSATLHREVGAQVKADLVLAVGQFAKDVLVGAASVGVQGRVVDPESVVDVLQLAPGDVVVVKASRGLGLESVAAELMQGDAR